MSSSMDSGIAVADFRPTHVVPPPGLSAWEAPDVSRPTAALDAFLPVQLLSRRGEWGEILCANGWSAWVDGRLLIAVPQPPPTTGERPSVRAEDPRPLLARGADALERYRHAVDELASGRADTDAFRRSLRGLRAGVVVDGESVWLYDETAERWMYGDGTRLATYAVTAGPPNAHGPQSPPAEPDGREAGAGPDAPPVGPDAGGPGRQAGPAAGPTRIVDTQDPEAQ
ncbi:hypothetical protein MRQ86_06065 [Streptomyces sp. MMS21 TC-5]|uniref:hypothetical protein n=1 Tax=Streptomyces TaxID=1883 RepID=UPI0006ADBA2B|nr:MULTISPECIES: hypothetical protein [unclassified Streptomyces]MCI4079912.1 hypothetical protein [Streptomyces sp. MMS21 TC-5]QNE28775.1 hypothetical protein F1D59_31720 [Streptomyces sp. INR7]